MSHILGGLSTLAVPVNAGDGRQSYLLSPRFSLQPQCFPHTCVHLSAQQILQESLLHISDSLLWVASSLCFVLLELGLQSPQLSEPLSLCGFPGPVL
jgi:hypothetical protein